MRFSNRPAGCHSKASCRNRPTHPINPAVPRPGPNQNAVPGHEVVIGAYAKTNGKFRSLLVGVNRGDHFVYVGRVGTGYGAKTVDTILPKLREIETGKSPFTGIGAPKKDANVVWVKPELVAEIQFAGWDC